MEADIDLLIAPLILRLWKNGIRTDSSCEENEPGIIWIGFPDHKDAKQFFDAVSLHVSDLVWSKGFCWNPEFPETYDGEGCFSIRFSQDDLRIVLKQFPAKVPKVEEEESEPLVLLTDEDFDRCIERSQRVAMEEPKRTVSRHKGRKP